MRLATAAGSTAAALTPGSAVGQDHAIAATRDAIALEAVKTTLACVVQDASSFVDLIAKAVGRAHGRISRNAADIQSSVLRMVVVE